jgi:2-oxo-4-hydroxy-4-carboxy-5-ureidoimidazoline decarboxylase
MLNVPARATGRFLSMQMSTVSSNSVFSRWNELDDASAASEVLPCCGSRAWARKLAEQRPFAEVQEMLESSDRVWASLNAEDWQEAFDSHPRIGQHHARAATAESLRWSSDEQRAAMSDEEATKLALAEGNRQYEEKFGRIFIVCASGKSAAEILALLNARLHNSAEFEWREAAEQQRQITQLRLRRWLGVE